MLELNGGRCLSRKIILIAEFIVAAKYVSLLHQPIGSLNESS